MIALWSFFRHMCFQSPQIVVEISFDHWSHENIRQPIESTSGSLHSDRRTSRAAIECIKVCQGRSARFLHVFVHLFLATRLHVDVVGLNPTRSAKQKDLDS